MHRIEFTITFTGADETTRSENMALETPFTPDPAGEQRLASNLSAELRVAVRHAGQPKHNETARKWLDFPKRATGFERYWDIENSQALWLELSNLILGVEANLAGAQAFKELEPTEEPSLEDGPAINNLFYLHDRKMSLLNQAVYGLIKVQDLVNRLLHESLGGDLVDTSKTEWEKYELTRKKVNKGLEAKHNSKTITESDFAAVTQALEFPEQTSTREVVLDYRNRLTHHIRPSVDYAMFFASLQSRAGEDVCDAQGKVIGRRYPIGAMPPVEYRFQALHGAFSEYLDAVVRMLQTLSELDILR